jgi:hypothetical protein
MLAGPVFSRNDRHRLVCRGSLLLCRDLLSRAAFSWQSRAQFARRSVLAKDSSEFCRPRCKAARRRSPAAQDICESAPLQGPAHLGEIEGPSFSQGHECACSLPQPGVRHCYHCRLADCWVRVENVFDLLGGDVFPSPDDEILLPARDDQATLGRDPGKVPGMEISLCVKSLGVLLGCRVTYAHFRPAGYDLAFLPGSNSLATGVDQPNFVADHIAFRRCR